MQGSRKGQEKEERAIESRVLVFFFGLVMIFGGRSWTMVVVVVMVMMIIIMVVTIEMIETIHKKRELEDTCMEHSLFSPLPPPHLWERRAGYFNDELDVHRDVLRQHRSLDFDYNQILDVAVQSVIRFIQPRLEVAPSLGQRFDFEFEWESVGTARNPAAVFDDNFLLFLIIKKMYNIYIYIERERERAEHGRGPRTARMIGGGRR